MLIVFLYLVLIFFTLSTIESTNFKKSYSLIFENHDRTSINLTNAFDFLCLFSNYLAFDEIKWSCAFTKYITQKFIIKARSTSTSFY